MGSIDGAWNAKSDDQLADAAARIDDFTDAGQAALRDELERRHLIDITAGSFENYVEFAKRQSHSKKASRADQRARVAVRVGIALVLLVSACGFLFMLSAPRDTGETGGTKEAEILAFSVARSGEPTTTYRPGDSFFVVLRGSDRYGEATTLWRSSFGDLSNTQVVTHFADASALIWIEEEKDLVGFYYPKDSETLERGGATDPAAGSGPAGYKVRWNVWLIDVKLRSLAAHGEFTGPDPPREIRTSQGAELAVVPPDEATVAAWIRTLPAK